MKYLHKLYLFKSKVVLHITSWAIDYICRYKHEGIFAGTRLLLNIRPDMSHIVDGEPEYINRALFRDLLFKVTVTYAAKDGAMKKYSAWINPDNIAYVHDEFAGTCLIAFMRGNTVAVVGNSKDILSALKDHNKRYAERMKNLYGGKDKQKDETGQ